MREASGSTILAADRIGGIAEALRSQLALVHNEMGITRKSVQNIEANLAVSPAFAGHSHPAPSGPLTRDKLLSQVLQYASPTGILLLYLAKRIEGRREPVDLGAALDLDNDNAWYAMGFLVACVSAGIFVGTAALRSLHVSSFPGIEAEQIRARLLQIIEHQETNSAFPEAAGLPNRLRAQLKSLDETLQSLGPATQPTA
jgi:hypothetical protein